VVKRQGPHGSEGIAFSEACKALHSSVRKSQKLNWASLYAWVDNDPWGVPYRIIVSGWLGKQPPGMTAIGRDKEIPDQLLTSMPITYQLATCANGWSGPSRSCLLNHHYRWSQLKSW